MMNRSDSALLCPPLALWDMDGTVLESMHWWRTILPEIVDAKGISLPADVRRELDGMPASRGLDIVTRMMMGEGSGTVSMEDIYEGMLRHYMTDVTLRPGAVELLQAQKAAGVRVVIASATRTEVCKKALARFGLLDLVDDYFTAEEAGASKGNPLYFERACARFGASVEDTVLFEDAYYSVKTAKSIGMRAVVTEDSYQAAHKDALFALADAYFTNGFLTRLK